jgi:hypothetical protein
MFTSSEFKVEGYKKLNLSPKLINKKHLYFNSNQFIKFDKL